MYSRLKYPSINIITKVAEELNTTNKPDWINEINCQTIENKESIQGNSKIKILFKGGCDLSQMLFYVHSNDIDIKEETNYVAANNMPIHQEHTQILLDSYYLDTKDKNYITNQNFIPFVDENFYKTEVFNQNYDCFLYSVLMDYTQDFYQHKTKNIKLLFGGYSPIWTDANNEENIVTSYKQRNIKVNADMLHKFRKEFEHIGKISPDDFVNNLHKLRKLIKKDIPIIFINGSEIDSPNANEINAKQRHIEMNKALNKFVQETDNTYILDVRKIIKKQQDLADNIRHYKRLKYKELSDELIVLLTSIFDKKIVNKIPLKVKMMNYLKNCYLIKFISKIIVRVKRKLNI